MTALDGRKNFEAYEQVECRELYPTRTDLEAYRTERLRRYARHAEFLRRRLGPRAWRLAEVGSGSSALLYALEQRQLLAEGLGIEPSASRHAFAELWRQERGFVAVRNVQADFAVVDLPAEQLDGFLVVDNTFSYLQPEDERYPRLLLERAWSSLRFEGLLVLELDNHLPVARNRAKWRRLEWTELPPSNPFKFALYEQTYHEPTNVLESTAIYLHRLGSERRKTEYSYVYDPDLLSGLVAGAGFEVTEVHGEMGDSPFDPDAATHLVVVGRKARGGRGEGR